eukprot:SAG11_NODE_2132_length_3775_cov_3.636017_1_plen_229_part_00
MTTAAQSAWLMSTRTAEFTLGCCRSRRSRNSRKIRIASSFASKTRSMCLMANFWLVLVDRAALHMREMRSATPMWKLRTCICERCAQLRQYGGCAKCAVARSYSDCITRTRLSRRLPCQLHGKPRTRRSRAPRFQSMTARMTWSRARPDCSPLRRLKKADVASARPSRSRKDLSASLSHHQHSHFDSTMDPMGALGRRAVISKILLKSALHMIMCTPSLRLGNRYANC